MGNCRSYRHLPEENDRVPAGRKGSQSVGFGADRHQRSQSDADSNKGPEDRKALRHHRKRHRPGERRH